MLRGVLALLLSACDCGFADRDSRDSVLRATDALLHEDVVHALREPVTCVALGVDKLRGARPRLPSAWPFRVDHRVGVPPAEAPGGLSLRNMLRGYRCATCRAVNLALRRCGGGCPDTRYCSKRCQVAHWRQGHRDSCAARDG